MRGGAIIYGRSDTTINRHGVRMGTSDIYSVARGMRCPKCSTTCWSWDSNTSRESYMPINLSCCVLASPWTRAFTGPYQNAIRTSVRRAAVPDEVFVIRGAARTLTGKKLSELPIKKPLFGHAPERVVNRDALANPASLNGSSIMQMSARRADSDARLALLARNFSSSSNP